MANVSTYEFVNDWLRPEVSWKIVAFTLKCPHSIAELEGVKTKLTSTHRLRRCVWGEGGRIWLTPGDRIRGNCDPTAWPHTEGIKPWHYAVYDDCQWVYTNKIVRDLWRLHLTNKIDNCDDPARPAYMPFGRQVSPVARYLINKKEIGEMLKNLSVNGRTKLLKNAGTKPTDHDNTHAQEQWREVSSMHYIEFFHPYHMLWLPPLGRRGLAHAIMKAD